MSRQHGHLAEAPSLTRVPLEPEPRERPAHWLSAEQAAAHPELEARLARLPALAEHATLDDALRGAMLHTHARALAATVELGGRSAVSFSTANYLGLAAHPEVIAAAQAALAEYGASMCVGRVSDQPELLLELEVELAAHLRAPAACVLASGYVANLAAFAHLFGPRDLVLHDRQMHASVLEGWRLSRAKRRSFPHNDLEALAALLRDRRPRARQAVIVVEGLYSVEGDLPDLPQLIRLARDHDCLLAIDESHSLGVLGSRGGGLVEHWGAPPDEVDLRSGSLGKSLCASAGFFASSARAVRALQLGTPTAALSTGAGIASVAIAKAALGVLRREPQRLARLRALSRAFRVAARSQGLSPSGADESPIASFSVGAEPRALEVATRLSTAGFITTPFLFPAVPRGQARLRFMLSAEHSFEQVRDAAEALWRVL